jgi:hypothetical protein
MPEDDKFTIKSVEQNYQNSRRLTTLWETMNQIDFTLLAYITSLFASNEALPQVEKTLRRGITPAENHHLKQLLAIVDHLESIFRRQRIVDCVEYCIIARDLLSKPSSDIPKMSSYLITLKSCIIDSLQQKRLLQITQDHFEFLDEDALFGQAVKARYPSATRDVKAAGECFGAECYAAAVFHLMRVAEAGLRSIVRDRRIPLADKQLTDKDWSQVLKKLEMAIFQLRAAPLTKWGGNGHVRDRQVAFYSELLQDLRLFDDAWKIHISHPGAAVFYNRDQTAEILRHVRSFMQKLATRLSESLVTEEFWSK